MAIGVVLFSYSRDDDKSYGGRLSALREVIQQELGAESNWHCKPADDRAEKRHRLDHA
jgi:hypothetical protein